MRASRLLRILLLLSVRGRVSAVELARELEVSLRTVYRDVEALNGAGVPIYAIRGRGGGFRLLDGYRTRLLGMSGEEADALFLSGLPGAATDLGLGSVLAATQLKLLAALPPDLRGRAARVRDRFHVDAPGWERRADATPLLATVAEAVWTQHSLDVGYQRADRTLVERVLEPLGLVLKAGAWYLVAQPSPAADPPAPDSPAAAHGPRAYRVSRLRTAIALRDTFEPPDGFDLARFWTRYQLDYEARLHTGTARIRVDADGRALLFLLGHAPADQARAAMSAPDADGWATTTVPIESHRHAKHALLQLGEHVEVLEPLELRAAVAGSARALANRYAGGSPLD